MENRHFKKFKTFEEREEYLSCQNIDNVNRDFVGLVKDVDDNDLLIKHLDYIKEDEQMANYETSGAHIIDYTEEYTGPGRYSLGWEESYTCDKGPFYPCPDYYAKYFTTENVKVKLTNLDKGQWIIYERDYPIGSPHELDQDRFEGYPSETNLGEESLSVLTNTAFIMTHGTARIPTPFTPGQPVTFKTKKFLDVDLYFLTEPTAESHPWKDDTNFKLEIFVQSFTCKEYEPQTPEIEEIGELNETT